MDLRYLIQKIFQRKKRPDDSDTEELRLDFKSRYQNFKRLLTANNKFLEIMAVIEHALQGKQLFGMSFVRANCTAASVNVFNMIASLERLAPGKYGELQSRFNDIQQDIDRLITRKKQAGDSRLVMPMNIINRDMADIAGSKMANLGEIKNSLDIRVPSGFVITTAAYNMFMSKNDLQSEIDRLLQVEGLDNLKELDLLASQIQQLIIASELPPEISDAAMRAWRQIESETGGDIRLALRSSAIGEDTRESSFAGQYRSILNVSPESFSQSYKEVVASKYSVPAIAYRMNRGFRDEDILMSVGCLAMVEAVSGGVLYSRSPVDMNDDSVFISSVWGLPKSVVDGSDNSDFFVVSRKPPIKLVREDIKEKKKKLVCFPNEGICRSEVTKDLAKTPSITEEQACRLAEIALTLEDYYSCPQDIEWAIDQSGLIYILQCRPMQQIAAKRKEGAYLSAETDKNILIKDGITASPGCASGNVFFVNKRADILQFPRGAVLVVKQALPVWASLLSRASAVISEHGGFAGHLANVAREFSVPALFSAENVMETIQNGEMVTVDADTRVVYKGKIESLLAETTSGKTLMQGSPVYETLEQVSRFIVPLTLLDPDSADFKPANCKALHDITRFIHEKSVHEMFNFGKEHDFSERSSKQLYYHVPMKWWILNLDDGFKEEVKGKYVRLENIASIPMLAFWEGFAAIPWDGPPPIDGKGLVSVMFQSTINTSLTPGMRSKFADRNYFMISKNYCNLSSRLGYHFATMEALVSDRAIENYVGFQFKGGAADYNRRLKRIHFIKDILERYDFRVDVNEDNLIARLEGYDRNIMEDRLRILGYLIIHTRQLDMIMTSRSTVDYYRKKIKEDIDKILGMPFSENRKVVFA